MKRLRTLVLALVVAAPLAAQAGAWPINCDDPAAKVEFFAEHYRPTKKGDYGPEPHLVTLGVGGVDQKKPKLVRAGGLLVYVFADYRVVYASTADAESQKTATVYDKTGKLITTAKCKN